MVALTLVASTRAQSQSHVLAIDIAGGPHVPVGNAALASNTGAAFSIGLVHRVNQRVALTTEFLVGSFAAGRPPSERVGTTDIGALSWAVGLEVLLTSRRSPWVLSARAEGGISAVGSDPVIDPDRPPFFIAKINDDVFSLSLGLQVGRSMGAVMPFFRIQPDVYFVGSNLRELQALDDDIGGSGTLIGIPLQLGLRLRFR